MTFTGTSISSARHGASLFDLSNTGAKLKCHRPPFMYSATIMYGRVHPPSPGALLIGPERNNLRLQKLMGFLLFSTNCRDSHSNAGSSSRSHPSGKSVGEYSKLTSTVSTEQFRGRKRR